MRRIMIIGSPGSGKSTLARKLGAALDLPVYHMDRDVFWTSGWELRKRADQRERIERIVAKDAWVFEGSNSGTYYVRLARADMVVWLDVPLGLRLWRVIRRQLRDLGRTRADMAEGCDERLSMLPGFLWWIIRTARGSRGHAEEFCRSVHVPCHRLGGIREANAFVQVMAEGGDWPGTAENARGLRYSDVTG